MSYRSTCHVHTNVHPRFITCNLVLKHVQKYRNDAVGTIYVHLHSGHIQTPEVISGYSQCTRTFSGCTSTTFFGLQRKKKTARYFFCGHLIVIPSTSLQWRPIQLNWCHPNNLSYLLANNHNHNSENILHDCQQCSIFLQRSLVCCT